MCYGTFPAKRHIMTAGPAGGLPVPLKEGNEDEILHDQAAEIFRRRDSGDSEFLQQKLTAAVDEKSHEKAPVRKVLLASCARGRDFKRV